MVLVKTRNVVGRWLTERTKKSLLSLPELHQQEIQFSLQGRAQALLLPLRKESYCFSGAFPRAPGSIPGETRGTLKGDWDPS